MKCDGCGNVQVTFSHASSVVRCSVCSKTLVVPRGGKAEIEGTILETME
ncbi:MAG: 30S ribosomal protein S27e [Hadesarchaea archaeon]|nr:30S ribosomal protein S27e [Hadesarchaea archaeon]